MTHRSGHTAPCRAKSCQAEFYIAWEYFATRNNTRDRSRRAEKRADNFFCTFNGAHSDSLGPLRIRRDLIITIDQARQYCSLKAHVNKNQHVNSTRIRKGRIDYTFHRILVRASANVSSFCIPCCRNHLNDVIINLQHVSISQMNILFVLCTPLGSRNGWKRARFPILLIRTAHNAASFQQRGIRQHATHMLILLILDI